MAKKQDNAQGKKQGDKRDEIVDIVRNKLAFHNYDIVEKLEAGIELHGTEVKSCRLRNVQINQAYAQIQKNEVFIYNLNISPYSFGNRFNHDPVRCRRLLLKKREILRLTSHLRLMGNALIPTRMYLKHGFVKIELGIAKGKTFGDKRETLRKKQDELDMKRSLGARR